MVKTSELSLVTRSSMVAKFNAGIAVKDIANEFNVSRQTVHYQIKKFKKHNDMRILKRSGASAKQRPVKIESLYGNLEKIFF